MIRKIILRLNLIFYIIILFIPIYDGDPTSGLLGQFFLAIFQLTIGLYLLISIKNKKNRRKAVWYWLLVIFYFMVIFFLEEPYFGRSIRITILFVVIPMCIGAYNIYINHLFQKL